MSGVADTPLPLMGGAGGGAEVLPDTPTPTPPPGGRGYRRDFPGLLTPEGQPWHYLDTAATAQKPRAVIDAMARALGADYATVHRGVYARSADMTLALRRRGGGWPTFIGGQEDEMVFVRGATEAINLVAHSWGGRTCNRATASCSRCWSIIRNIVPWQMLRERWASQIDVCPLTQDGRIDLDAAEAMLTPQHKMVALAHVSNVLGSVLDVRRAGDMAHAVGRSCCSTAVRRCRACRSMSALGCDFYVFSAHKLYGPTGIGALWGRPSCSMPCRPGRAAAR
jgi:cysteine desulfurase/selenocysteine lyase